jgi:GDP/UDP-N,N'-diacetylbacillosamine 2-epimerase (hydrolysing)
LVGGIGIDNIKSQNLAKKNELEKFLNFKFKSKNLLITFHPITLDIVDSESQIRELLLALSDLNDTQLIFTLPNADNGSRNLIKIIKDFASSNSNSCVFTNLGQFYYLSLISHVDAVIGNSSSGLIEAPSLKVGTINIGSRQSGRLKAKSVIDCMPNKKNICDALSKIYSNDFQKKLENIVNPYGEGGAVEKIINVIKTCNLSDITRKVFYDQTYNNRIF